LFELTEALLVAWWVRTFVGLSHVPVFRRGWPSVYAALADGRVDREALRRLQVQYAPLPVRGGYVVAALDSTPYPRPYAETSPDRTLVHVPAEGLVLPRGTAPVKAGWQYSVLALVPPEPSSFTYILDNLRIPSTQTPTETALAQLTALSAEFKVQHPAYTLLCVHDAGYATVPFVAGLAAMARAAKDNKAQHANAGTHEPALPLVQYLPVSCLVRAPANRVLYRAAPIPEKTQRGRPRKHGAPFQGKKPETHGTPDATWSGTDANGRGVTVRCWGGMHLQKVADLPITVVCVTREAARGTTRDPRDTWFWWIGDPLPTLPDLAGLYQPRFRIEHGLKLDKNDLIWLDPKLRYPERAQTWTDVVSVVHNQLTLSRDAVAAERFPWEDPARPLTPAQVRRGIPKIIAYVGTPAQPPRVRGKSPGRAAGTPVPKAARHKAIRKGTKRRRRSATAA
jgi:hypothetical protein